GFGGGEHLLHRATEAPATGFIGVEPFVNGMAKMMTALDKRPLANLRVYDDDATRLLDWLPPASLDGIDLLYPDPWPKKKHWKRRFVSPANLDRLARVLKPGGRFRFASDIDSYVNWTLLACSANGSFAWQANEAADWHTPYEGWPGTRYEAKALRAGRRPAYLTFIRK
ncbi:MAG: tRNA (guanosine(46)-N7)-methyltransferase TrmB, partial [Mesorhizobium sp.]